MRLDAEDEQDESAAAGLNAGAAPAVQSPGGHPQIGDVDTMEGGGPRAAVVNE
jgi:hypothetical protein